jgi:hypothetical protein
MQVIDVLERGIDEGTHIGAPWYVSDRGAVVVDRALGDARSGVP